MQITTKYSCNILNILARLFKFFLYLKSKINTCLLIVIAKYYAIMLCAKNVLTEEVSDPNDLIHMKKESSC